MSTVKTLFISLFLVSFFFIFSSRIQADTIICPKDVSSRPSGSIDNLYLKCNGTTRYAGVCYKSTDICPAANDTQSLCAENETCQRLDALSPHDSPCIKCVPKVIISNKTTVSGTVTATGNIMPDNLRITIKPGAYAYDVYPQGGKMTGYTSTFENSDAQFNTPMSLTWTILAYKGSKLIGEASGDGGSLKYGVSNILDMEVYTNDPSLGLSECPSAGSNPTHYCKSAPNPGSSDTLDSAYVCKDINGTPSLSIYCYKKATPPPPPPGPDTTSCESVAGPAGTTFKCEASSACTGGTLHTGDHNGCPASVPFCCKRITAPPPAALPGAPKVSGYERSCVNGQISYKFNFTPGSGATTHKLQYVGVAKGDNTTVPVDQYNNYTSGMIIPPSGGNGFVPGIQVNYDILACNSAGCTPDPMHWWSIDDTGSACAATGPCSTHGGIKTGTTADGVCDRKVFNGTDAKKTVAEGNPYFGKTYELRYTCNDPGTYEYINSDTTTCSKKVWFDPPAEGGSTPGGTKTCYKDADGDGYGSSTGGTQANQTTCAAGWSESNNDCYDGNASANPGQTGDFYVARDGTPNGSFDYNCNGQNDKKYATHGFGSLPTGICLADMPSGTVGFSNDMQCGTTGTFRLCYKFKNTACGGTSDSDAVSDTIGRPCPGGAAGSGWALVDLASVPQNCK